MPDAALFAALSDPTRLQLLERLQAEPGQSTSALTEGSGVTRQAVTRHLAVLAAVGLVREGHERAWEIDASPLAAITAWIASVTVGPTIAREAAAEAPPVLPSSEPVHSSPGVAGVEASAFTAPRKPAVQPGKVRRWRVPR